jgi:S1-C subfamily serine protease
MAGRTPDPGGGRGDGPQDPDDRRPTDAPRAWLHPSELGARFDTPAAGTPVVPAPDPAPPGRGVRIMALAAAGLLLVVVGFAAGTRLARRDPAPVAAPAQARTASGPGPLVAAPVAPIPDASHTATVITTTGRRSAVCVDGGLVTALEGLGTSQVVEVATGRSSAPALLAATDAVSGIAYLAGVECDNGPMDMRAAASPAAGSRVRVLARPAGSTGVTVRAVRVVAAGGHVSGVREGTAVLRAPTDTSVLGAPVITDTGALVGIVVGLDASGARVAPTELVRRVVAQLVSGRPPGAGWLGVRIDPAGVVTALAPDSPAGAAGVTVGDTVYAADGRRTVDAEALLVALQARAPGERLRLTLERSGRTRDVDVTLGSAPGGG